MVLEDGRRQEDLVVVHCFCMCGSSALLRGFLGVSRSMEREFLFVLLIYPRIFLSVFIVCCLLLGMSYCVTHSVLMCMCVSCFGLVASTCRVIG